LHTLVTAQDPQFSQFYAAPLYLNPAFAGGTGQARAGMNYRNQWPAIDANFTTMSVYGDYFFEDINSLAAIGCLIILQIYSGLNLDLTGVIGLLVFCMFMHLSQLCRLSRSSLEINLAIIDWTKVEALLEEQNEQD
jgi:hypothetical protein